MKISLREQADLYGSLSGLEGNLKTFLDAADQPAAPMDAVIDASSKIADQIKAGAQVTSGEVGQVMSLMPAVSASFDNVYKLIKSANAAGYEVAKQVGANTTGAPRTKKPPTDYSGIPDADIMKGVADLAPKFKAVLANVKDLGKQVADQASGALNDIDKQKSDGVEATKALVPTWVKFRDSTSGYYSILNSMARRVNQLLTNIGHSKTDAPKGEPVTETMIVIPWGDEFGDYDDGMLEVNDARVRDAEGKVVSTRCKCGAKVDLTDLGGHDTECPKCGQPYNSFGQALKRDHDEREDGDMDYESLKKRGKAMIEARKAAAKKAKTEEIPVGAAGNLPKPSSAPPIGVETKISLPPMMQVERLVRSLKNQIIEGLK